MNRRRSDLTFSEWSKLTDQPWDTEQYLEGIRDCVAFKGEGLHNPYPRGTVFSVRYNTGWNNTVTISANVARSKFPCPQCDGDGELLDGECNACHGTGYLKPCEESA